MEEKYKTKTIEHLGLVAGMIDELRIVEIIDQEIKQDFDQRQVTVGQAVKAMILNGLGFANRRLYLATHFFENKPTEQLIGKGVTASKLNEDTLGKALEKLYKYGVTELYSLISGQAVKHLELKPKVGHDDTTSFHTDGNYNSKSEIGTDTKVVKITKGYSRDNRPELNQIGLELIIENEASLPLAMLPLSGNANDKIVLKETIDRHIKQLETVGISILVKDSAGYTKDSLEAHQEVGLKWIMRVPAILKEVKEQVAQVNISKMKSLVKGYKYSSVLSEYGGVEQRWLIIYSEVSKKSRDKRAERELLKTSQGEEKAFKKLSKQSFHCEADAKVAMDDFENSLKVLKIYNSKIIEKEHYEKAGRPAKDAQPTGYTYHISGEVVADVSAGNKVKKERAVFILATNELDHDTLRDAEILSTYKGQAKVERGFRFLKDPMFLASTLYLKKEERIMALLMVMTCCLLVYSALEHRIRLVLSTHDQSVPNQKGKPTYKPTAKWVFELFVDVHLLFITTDNDVEVLTMNLKSELKSLLALLGPNYPRIYFKNS